MIDQFDQGAMLHGIRVEILGRFAVILLPRSRHFFASIPKASFYAPDGIVICQAKQLLLKEIAHMPRPLAKLGRDVKTLGSNI
jgi:hypothetical protein